MHKGRGQRQEKGKRKTQEEPCRKGTNGGQEQPTVTRIKGEDRGRKEGREKPKRNHAGKEQMEGKNSQWLPTER